MTFKPGESGNPNGRPAGTQNKRSQLARLLEPYAEELVAKTVELARQGDVTALRLCLERLIPKAKQESISIEIDTQKLSSHEYMSDLGKQILTAVATGDITPTDARLLSIIVDNQRKLIESCELMPKLEAIEQKLK